MSLQNPFLYGAPILEFDTIDSTNNYAMQLIDADKAESGLMVLANAQTSGKGQRGKMWLANAGEALLMSIILRPGRSLQQQIQFLAAIAVSVAKVCEQMLPEIPVKIKWPNDIIIADKKAGGILIENLIRGNSWEWSVIGIGLNVHQQNFPVDLPLATSLAAQGGETVEIRSLAIEIRTQILLALASTSDFLGAFNAYLYRHQAQQMFKDDSGEYWGKVLGMNDKGQLDILQDGGQKKSLIHGEAVWVW